jgi:release factor glutamine methyltransferase
MKMNEAENWIRQQLILMYDEREATSIASMVMENVTGLTRIDRLTKKDEPLVVQQLHHLTEVVQRLGQHEPIQYVLGECFFHGLKLYVNNHVLIPRPETEELVEWIINDVKTSGKNVFQRKEGEADETTQLKVLDVGTGSGCIALALKKAMPKAEVWGCDVSDEALNVARRNGAQLDIRVDFQGINFLDESQQRSLPTVDIIVSNPPYVPEKDKATMRPNVLAHEPHTALFVPDDDALIFYKTIALFGHKRLYENGCIYIEISENAAKETVRIFKEAGYNNVEIKKDMQGKDRMIKAHLKAHPDFPGKKAI